MPARHAEAADEVMTSKDIAAAGSRDHVADSINNTRNDGYYAARADLGQSKGDMSPDGRKLKLRQAQQRDRIGILEYEDIVTRTGLHPGPRQVHGRGARSPQAQRLGF